MAKIIRFDKYIDAHTLKRQMVNDIDFKNMLALRLYQGDLGINKPAIAGGLEHGRYCYCDKCMNDWRNTKPVISINHSTLDVTVE